LSLCLTAGAVGCGADDGADAQTIIESERISVVDGSTFDELFMVVDSLTLEESDAVTTVFPYVTVDPQGGFLVADPREHQVRVYSRQGKLEQIYGAGTATVDSIDRPYLARRLPDGAIAVANLVGPLTVIPHDSGQASRFIPFPFRLMRGLEVLSDHEILLVGPDSARPTASLHILDLRNERIVGSFLAPPPHLHADVRMMFSSVRTARRGNRLAAVHMSSDTLVFFDLMGTELSRVPIPIDPFIAPLGPLPNVESPAEQDKWLNQFTHITNLFWIDDDGLIVQWDKVRNEGTDWGIVQLDTTGTRLWAVAPAPRLIAIHNDEFFFQDPASDRPNRWIVAKRRMGP
jgi:hypothetical protein